MPTGTALVVGGGAQAGAPFTLGHLLYVSNVSPPQISTFGGVRALDGAVEYVGIPDSAGNLPAIVGSTQTLRVVGGVILQGPTGSPTSVAIGNGTVLTAVNGNGQIVIGYQAQAAGLNDAVTIGFQANSYSGGGVVLGFQAYHQNTIGGVVIGASAYVTGSGGGQVATVLGGGASCALGTTGTSFGVVIGDNASAGHGYSVVVGGNASASLASNNAQDTVVIGALASSSKGYTTVVGGQATTVQPNSIIVGALSTITAGANTNSIVIGTQSTTGNSNEIILGSGNAAIGANTLQLGGPNTDMQTVVLGAGATIVSPAARKLSFTSGSGADNAAGAFTIQAPLGTGAAVPAGVVISGGNVAGSSAVVQTAVPIATFRTNATVASIAEWVAGQVTFRIVGGSTNGLAIRNSGNTRDNFNVNDAGTSISLNGATYGIAFTADGASGEMPAGFSIGGQSTATNLSLFANSQATAGNKVVVNYFSTGNGWYSAAEVANVAAGFGTLSLMKSGGVVNIGNNNTGTADNLTIGGTAYGVGVASLRFNGLTTAATNNLVGTLTNSPVTGNPTFWMPVSIAGVIKYIPCW